MAIKIGDQLPAGVLWEFIEQETPGCSVGPNSFKVEEQVRGKRIAIFGLPGRIHADLLGQAPARVRRQSAGFQGAQDRRDLVHFGQRRLRHGRVGPGAGRRAAKCG